MGFKNKKDINLLYAYEISKKNPNENYKLFIIVFVIECAILILLTFFVSVRIVFINSQNIKLQNSIKTYAKMEKELSEFKKINDAYTKKQRAYDNVTSLNADTLSTLDILQKIMPNDISIENFSLKDDKLFFIVSASKEENIAQFIANMQKTEKFINITIDGISSDSNKKRSTINAELDRK